MAILEVVKIFLTVAGTLGAAWLAGWWNKKGKEVDGQSAPYEALANRVGTLENQVASAQLWIALTIPIHVDVTNRWSHYRQQENPPVFPPYPPTKE